MARRSRRNSITEQFAARPVAMLETVMPVLSQAAHKVLMRIEIENAHHGGAENGRLPVTYQDFIKYGVHIRMIAPAIRELEAVGIIEVTERGCGGNAEFRRPSLYRLTFRHARGETGDGTHEWKRIKTVEEAEAIAKAARDAADPSKVARGKKQNFAATKCQVSLPQSDSETAIRPLSQSGSTVPLSLSGSTLEISDQAAEIGKPLAKRAINGAVASEQPNGMSRLFAANKLRVDTSGPQSRRKSRVVLNNGSRK